MTTLCNRCELLFGECRPLLGQVACPALGLKGWEIREAELLPKTPAKPIQAAALAVNDSTGDAHLIPIFAFDFYRKEPA